MEPSLIVGLHQEYESLSNDGFRVLAGGNERNAGEKSLRKE